MGSKPASPQINRRSASVSCGHAGRIGLGRLVPIPGHEFAGIVESVGPDAANVKVGEAVYALADRDGSDAEYIAIAASDLAPKPRTLDFTQAAPHCQGATANIIPPSDRRVTLKLRSLSQRTRITCPR